MLPSRSRNAGNFRTKCLGFCPFFYSLCFCWQKQIGHNIKFGQRPPSLRKSEGDEGSSDEEEVPQSPLRVLAQVENEPQETEAKEIVS